MGGDLVPDEMCLRIAVQQQERWAFSRDLYVDAHTLGIDGAM
ncbi:hypothetical protein K530_53060 [Streptomyces noursei CCRC 11814]|nr:hypothetical protein K530_53060 [Streptomyces noursei CCRC 11814]